jgi:phage uncharacterized protein (putative large terminase), C-terminal domain
MIDKRLLKQEVQIELARREFWSYCNLLSPDFYKPNRTYLVTLCNELQAFYETDEYNVLIINEPPRHGKSRTVSCFVEWVLGRDVTQKIMTGSYNEILSTTFSKNVRNTINEVKADKYKPVYSDVFPSTKIKRGDGAMNLWSLENGYNSYLATSPTGTATGFGCNILIIDDLIKSAEEAHNESVKEKHWDWFINTMLSRLEQNGKIIIIMTRWASDDLAGRALDHYGINCRHVCMKALQDDDTMLCDEILSRESYEEKRRSMGEDIASANYQQIPIDIQGRLYQSFKTYTDLPKDEHGNLLFTGIANYTDTADEGADFLCAITYGIYNNEAYVLDVYYTKDSMEITEDELAARLIKFNCNTAKIESNNGGRGYARSVDRIMREKHKSNVCDVKWFHQSKNKQARILTNSSWVSNHIYFPSNWRDRFPEYYNAMFSYQKEGKNKHDDAPDATTGVAEQFNKTGATYSFK